MTEVTEGIYLETKKTNVGTGHTSSQVVFRSFYAVRPSGQGAEIFLLDDDLGITGLREQISVAELTKRMQYIPRLQKRYQALATSLGPRPAQAAKPKPQPKPAAPKAPPKPEPQAAAPAAFGGQGETPWWEQSRDSAQRLLKKK